MTESSEIADLLCTLAPRFNRLVFYPGDIPHSGALTAPELLSDDPQKGRLMLNMFFSVVPKPILPKETEAEARADVPFSGLGRESHIVHTIDARWIDESPSMPHTRKQHTGFG